MALRAVGPGHAELHRVLCVTLPQPCRSMLVHPSGHDGHVVSVRWSHHGGNLLSSGHDRTVRLWAAGAPDALLMLPADAALRAPPTAPRAAGAGRGASRPPAPPSPSARSALPAAGTMSRYAAGRPHPPQTAVPLPPPVRGTHWLLYRGLACDRKSVSE